MLFSSIENSLCICLAPGKHNSGRAVIQLSSLRWFKAEIQSLLSHFYSWITIIPRELPFHPTLKEHICEDMILDSSLISLFLSLAVCVNCFRILVSSKMDKVSRIEISPCPAPGSLSVLSSSSTSPLSFCYSLSSCKWFYISIKPGQAKVCIDPTFSFVMCQKIHQA